MYYVPYCACVPDDLEATMVTSGPASSLNPMALGGALSGEEGRREGKRECRDTAGLFVSRVTCHTHQHRDTLAQAGHKAYNGRVHTL